MMISCSKNSENLGKFSGYYLRSSRKFSISQKSVGDENLPIFSNLFDFSYNLIAENSEQSNLISKNFKNSRII